MDLIFLIASFLLAILSPLAISFLARHNKPDDSLKLPPGSFGWPIIGETLQFMMAMRRGKVEGFIKQRTEKYSSPVFKTSLLGEKMVIFPGQTGNKFIFTNEYKLFTPWMPVSLTKLFPSLGFINIEHEAQKARKYISFFFRSDAVHRLVTLMNSVSEDHLNKYWKGKYEVRVLDLVKLFTFTLACRTFMGVEDEKQISILLHHFDILLKGFLTLHFNIPGTPFYKAVKAGKELRNEIRKITEKKKAEIFKSRAGSEPARDLLSNMLQATDQEHMSDLEMEDKIVAYLVGAHETSTSVISFTIKYLAEHPDAYHHILKEQQEIRESMKPRDELCWDDIQKMKRTWNFASEVMRVIPTIQGSFRETKSDFTFQGFLIPKGWKVYWSVGMTHKNQDYFSDPERFNPPRFEENEPSPYTFIPFGAGPVMCPGREFARVTILVFLHHVMKNFKWEIKLPGEKIIYDTVPVPAEGIPVRLFSL